MIRKFLPGLLTVAPMTALCAWPGDDGAEPSLRDALGAAIDAGDEDPGASGTTTDDGNTPAEPPAPGPAEPPAPPSDGTAPRDSQGRFVAKTGPATATPPVTPPVGTAPPVPQPGAVGQPPAPGLPAPQALQAPVGWTPQAREVWAQVPPAAQAEIARRETEMARGMTENAAARDIATNLRDMIAPYVGRMRMQGVTPFQALENLLITETTLGTGTMQQRAEQVARLVKAYGVDIQALDSALAGVAMPQQANVDAQVQALVAQQMAPFHQFMQQAQQAQQSAWGRAQNEVGTSLQTFAADPKNEFYEDVRDIMADLVEVAQRHGQVLTLQEAYDRAVWMHPQVKGVIEARQQAQAAAGLNGAAQRAKRAAVSLSGAPALGAPDDTSDLSLRGAIAAAMDANSRV